MHPVIVHLSSSLPLYSYGAMLGLSLIVGWYLTLALAEKDGVSRPLMGECYLWIAASALVGARLLFVITNPQRFHGVADVLRVTEGGLVAYGGFLGGLLGAIVFCRLRGIRLLAVADCAVPSLCTGLLITRIGCFLNGCDFGSRWDGAWAVRFPAGSPAFLEQRAAGLLPADAVQSLAVHPTQLYEALIGLILLGLMFPARWHRKFSGQMLVVFTLGYAVLRFAVETLRADGERGTLGPLSTSQFIGVATFVAGTVLLGWLYRQWRADPKAMRLWENGRAMVAASRR